MAACVNYRHEHKRSTVYTIHRMVDWQPTTTQRCHPLVSSWLLSFCATSCILTTTSTIPGLSQPHLHFMLYLRCRGTKPLVSFYSSCKQLNTVGITFSKPTTNRMPCPSHCTTVRKVSVSKLVNSNY